MARLPAEVLGVALVLCASSAYTRGVAQAPTAERAPGLILELENDAGASARPDARVARTVALYVADGRPASPFGEPGRFRATWRGELEVAFRDRYVFSVRGNGTATLAIDGEVVELDRRLRLSRGLHQLEVRYGSPAAGPAEFALLWAGGDFDAEPISPERLSHDPADPVLLEGAWRRRGRELLADRQCTKCHTPPTPMVLSTTSPAMPELGRDAPSLAGIGGRLRQEWMARWVLDPAAFRSHARMPRVLRGEQAKGDAVDIASYLASLGEDAGEAPVEGADALRGGVLFAELGCIACHTSPTAVADGDRVDLSGVAEKWRPAALVDFLRDPARYYEWIEMPDFDLDQAEAADIAEYLLTAARPAGPDVAVGGDAARGQALVQSAGCLKCHFVGEPGSYRGPELGALKALDRGCLASGDGDRGAAPDFGLDDQELRALRVAVPEWRSLGRHVPAEFAERQLKGRRCAACHDLDGRPAAWSTHLGEVSDLVAEVEAPKLAQNRPSLTWAGDKLNVDWTAALLSGGVSERTRPWLRSRMPSFSAVATDLAAGLAAQFGHAPTTSQSAPPDPALAEIGERLISVEEGFACVLCHALGSLEPIGVFEVQGTNFATTVDRLREPYFHRWMANPLRVDPSSRMPKYTDDSGKTGFVDVLDGDGRRQFDAMWHYLKTLR